MEGQGPDTTENLLRARCNHYQVPLIRTSLGVCLLVALDGGRSLLLYVGWARGFGYEQLGRTFSVVLACSQSKQRKGQQHGFPTFPCSTLLHSDGAPA